MHIVLFTQTPYRIRVNAKIVSQETVSYADSKVNTTGW